MPAREAELAARLGSDADRLALTALLASAPPQGKSGWVQELHAMLDGMPGHEHATPACLGEALREFVANGGTGQPNIRHFRGYVRRAKAAPAEALAAAAATTESASNPLPPRRARRDADDVFDAIDRWSQKED